MGGGYVEDASPFNAWASHDERYINVFLVWTVLAGKQAVLSYVKAII